ncbi:MAG: zinc ribbon domain-containing protein [Caldimonas sp.]
MALTNYRDISPPLGDVGAGFQFEFFCESCGDTWKTPFKPYRAGQATGVFRRFGYLFNEFAKISVVSEYIYRLGRAGGTSIEATGGKAKAAALEEAHALAAQRYDKCENCRTMVCANCYDEATRRCLKCDRAEGVGAQAGTSASASASASATVCPNCQTPSQGGRFCHECGFDMASTHKSCPSCSATMSRQARFCTDCGHSF